MGKRKENNTKARKSKVLRGWGYSDDCAGWSGVCVCEYDVPDLWMDLYLGEEKIGKIRMVYDSGWGVQLFGNDKEFSVKPPDDYDPEVVDD